MMDEQEQQLVLKGFNNTARPYDTSAFVHGIFAEHAQRQPAAPCVIFEDHVHSYAEVGCRLAGGHAQCTKQQCWCAWCSAHC